MATCEIYLLQPIDNLGGEGDLVTVKAGYARNYLLPRGLAIPVNRGNQRYIEALQKRKADRLAKELETAKALAEKLANVRIAIAVKTGEGGKMFGSVTSQDLIERLAQEGIQLERRQLNLHTPVKTLGKHVTKIRLHPEIQVELEWEVVSENPIEGAPQAQEMAAKEA